MSFLNSLLKALGLNDPPARPAAAPPAPRPAASPAPRPAAAPAAASAPKTFDLSKAPTSELLSRLEATADLDERRAAMKELRERRELAALPAQIAGLGHPDEVVREAALEGLYRQGAAARPALAEVLQATCDPSSRVRYQALLVLTTGAMNSPAQEVYAAVMARLGDSDAAVRRQALSTLGTHLSSLPAPLVDRALRGVLAAMRDPDESTRRQAAYMVNGYGSLFSQQKERLPEVVAALGPLLESPDKELRWYAASALPTYAPTDPRPVAELVQRLLTGEDYHLNQASTALHRIEHPDVERALERAEQASDEGRLRVAFVRLLRPKGAGPMAPFEQALRSGAKPTRLLAARLVALASRPAAESAPLRPTLLAALAEGDPELAAAALRALRCTGPGDEVTVGAVLGALKSPNKEVRQQATETLWTVARGSKAAVPALRQGLRDRDEEMRSGAARVLGWFGREAAEAAPDLIELLRGDPRAVHYALYPLGSIGPAAADAAPLLVDLIFDAPTVYTREEAAEVLARVGAAGVLAGASGRLLPLLRRGSLRMRRALAQAAAGAKAEALPLLAGIGEALGEADEPLRRYALDALAGLGPGAAPAVPAVLAALPSLDDNLGQRALDLLISLGPLDPGAGDALVAMVRARPAAPVRRSLGQLVRLGPASVLPLLEATQSADEALCREAAALLKRLGLEQLEALEQALSHPDASLRMRAVGALGQLGAAARPALRRALGSDDEVVRTQAEIALALAASCPPSPSR